MIDQRAAQKSAPDRIEFLRVQPYHLIGRLTTAQLFAAAMAAGGVLVLRRAEVR